MISVTPVSGIREQLIVGFILADPVVAALRLRQIFHLAAQTPPSLVSADLEDFYLGLVGF